MSKKMIIAVALSILCARAEAAPTEVQLFHRCYSQITGTRAAPNHPTLLQVASGQLTALSGCLEVLSKATLLTSGMNEGRTTGEINPASSFDVQDAQNITQTFFNFHKTWATLGTFADAINLSGLDGTDEIYSRSELASHLSYVLFHPSLSYQNLVRGVRSVTEVRDGASANGRFSVFYNPYEMLATSHLLNIQNLIPGSGLVNPAQMSTFGAAFLPQGVLHGFRALRDDEMNVRMKVGFSASSASYTDQFETPSFNTLQNLKYRRARGGGVIGTPSYLMLNMGAGWTPNGYPRANGANKLWRRIVRNSFSDFMCRSLPTLSSSDVIAYVQPSSSIPFRNNSSCMSCHTTLDLGAGAFRNFSISSNIVHRELPGGFPRTSEIAAVETHPSMMVDAGNLIHESLRDGSSASYATAEANLLAIDGASGDNAFFRRPPNGRFVMRTYDNQLIDQSIYDVEGFGTQISNTDDFYICAAKRYVNFFTGFDATMQEVPNADPSEVRSRQLVVQLGLQLKQHQSLKLLIQAILSSDLYRESYE